MNAGPTDQEYGSQRNSGETNKPSHLKRTARKRCQIISRADVGTSATKVNPFWEAGTPSEGKPAGQLKLAPDAGGGQDLAYVIGEITLRILEDGIPASPQEKRTLSITRNAKIRMAEKVISFRSNRDLPFVNDCKFFVQSGVKLREPRPLQDVSSGIAKLTGWWNRKSAWIKPA
jgi:hypothetical protein